MLYSRFLAVSSTRDWMGIEEATGTSYTGRKDFSRFIQRG
jgi:hypothetical protein